MIIGLHCLFTFLGPPDDGLISHISSSKQTAMSEDLSSIVSLSDKYRQQEEIEIFHEQYQKPPPEPIRPKQPKKSPTTPASSRSTESTESPPEL